MSKKQKEYENELCVCGHMRKLHSGIDGFCYVSRCECKAFKKKEEKP